MRGRRVTIVDRFRAQRIPLGAIVVGDEVTTTPTFASPAAAHVPAWRGHNDAPPRLELKLNARLGGTYGIQWTINDRALEHDHASHDHESLPLGAWSKVRFTNESFRLHPMHIHGLFFKVLARNGAPVDEPHWRDTVLLHAKDTVDVGTVPLDPGLWMAHCHILEHAESGMMTIVEIR
jgi:FtsP/CotA-like multicopper oxidase with cupredoxin domain